MKRPIRKVKVAQLNGHWGYLDRPEGEVRISLGGESQHWPSDWKLIASAGQKLSLQVQNQEYFRHHVVRHRLNRLVLEALDIPGRRSETALGELLLLKRDRWCLARNVEEVATKAGNIIPHDIKRLLIPARRARGAGQLVLTGTWVGEGASSSASSSGLMVPPVAAAPAMSRSELATKTERTNDTRSGKRMQAASTVAKRQLEVLGHLRWIQWALEARRLDIDGIGRSWLDPEAIHALEQLLDRYGEVHPTWCLSAALARDLAETQAEAGIERFVPPYDALFVRIPRWVEGPSREVGAHVFVEEDGFGVACVFAERRDEPPYFYCTSTRILPRTITPPFGLAKRLIPAWTCLRHLLLAVSRESLHAPVSRQPGPVAHMREKPHSAVVRRQSGGRSNRVRKIPIDPIVLELTQRHFERRDGRWQWSRAGVSLASKSIAQGCTWVKRHMTWKDVLPQNLHDGERSFPRADGKYRVRRLVRHHKRGRGATPGDPDYRS